MFSFIDAVDGVLNHEELRLCSLTSLMLVNAVLFRGFASSAHTRVGETGPRRTASSALQSSNRRDVVYSL